MPKRARILWWVFLSVILVSALTVFFGFNGGLATNVEDKSFTNVRLWFHQERGEMQLVFEDVLDGDKEVWIEIDNKIDIRVDSELTEPALWARPAWEDRFFGATVFYKANQAVLVVQSEIEKQVWELVIKYAREKKQELMRTDNEWALLIEKLPYTSFANYDLEFAINNIELVVYGIELAFQNEKYTEFQTIYDQVLVHIETLNIFEGMQIPRLGFSSVGESYFGGEVAAIYIPELNIIVLNKDQFEYLRSYDFLTLKMTIFHELGHSWFSQLEESARNEYYKFVLSTQEDSPYSLTRRILASTDIDKENPNEWQLLFLQRAVEEDFAESFAQYLAVSDSFARRYLNRFVIFCKIMPISYGRCALYGAP